MKIPNTTENEQMRSMSIMFGLLMGGLFTGIIMSYVSVYYFIVGMGIMIGGTLIWLRLLEYPNPDRLIPTGSEYLLDDKLGGK